jgi:hypothetical protein
VRDAIDAPHKLLAFDRSKKTGQFTHLRERARGITKATPDTLLMVVEFPGIWWEWKDRGQKPDDDQHRMLQELRDLGQHAGWSDSIVDYHAALAAIGVPMRPNAALLAQHYDLSADGVIAKAEMKRGQPPKKAGRARPEKPTRGQVRRVNAVRSRLMF